jgi:hypothetical protein
MGNQSYIKNFKQAHGLSDEEKIAVAKIRISHPSLKLAAALQDFRAADKLLLAWSTYCNEYFCCDYEITFLDGFVLHGKYETWKKSRTRPTLSTSVRALLSSFTCTQKDQIFSPENFLTQKMDVKISSSANFFDRYEIDGM